MKYVPSLIGVGQLSGKAGNNVASRNRNGSYIRTRVIPTLVQNAATTAVRGNFSTLSSNWRLLTDAQRAAWADFGGNVSRTDSLGQVYTLTGQQAYLLVNRNLFTMGVASTAVAPTFSPPAAPVTLTITATSV